MDFHQVRAVSIRVLAGLVLISLQNEYGFSIIQCEGPSMMPTIHPLGEMIVVERFTHRLFGLDDGDTAEERVARARTAAAVGARTNTVSSSSSSSSLATRGTTTSAETLVLTWHPDPHATSSSSPS